MTPFKCGCKSLEFLSLSLSLTKADQWCEAKTRPLTILNRYIFARLQELVTLTELGYRRVLIFQGWQEKVSDYIV